MKLLIDSQTKTASKNAVIHDLTHSARRDSDLIFFSMTQNALSLSFLHTTFNASIRNGLDKLFIPADIAQSDFEIKTEKIARTCWSLFWDF